MLSRRTFIAAFAGCLSACAGPAPAPKPAETSTAEPTPPARAAPPTLVPTATRPPVPTAPPTSVPGPTAVPTATPQSDANAQPAGADVVAPPPFASLAVMIENQADARPQTGLTHADVVYEALAEGGITRFIALFLTDNAATVGPVRSLRHYFAFLAAEYGADVVHIGASPEGYAWRDAMHMGHLDETFGEPGIWRVASRPPPHNAYTDTAADRVFLRQRGWQQNYSWGPLLFADEAPRGQLSASSIELGFRPWAYRVGYAWDDTRGRYLRIMEGAPHLDAQTGEQIAPASVVIQFADIEAIPNDPKYRLDVNLAGGGGPLVVLSDGTRRDGAWIKTDPQSPSVWLDVGGNPIVLPPGPIWVEVLPLQSPLTVSP